MNRLRQRVFGRVGLGALSAAALAGCDQAATENHLPQVSPRQVPEEAVSLDPSRAPVDPSPWGAATAPGNVPAPDPQLSISPAAVLYPLVVTVTGAAPYADVLVEIASWDRGWSLEFSADAAGTAVWTGLTGPALVGGELLFARGEADGLPTNEVSFDVAVPACAFDTNAQPGTVDVLAEGLLVRVCEDVPADGICEVVADFHAWRAHDLLVNEMADLVPPEFAVAAVCDETSIATECCYVVEIDDLTVADPGGGGGGGGGGGWGGGGGYLGRPLTVDGVVRHPAATSCAGWSRATPIAADRLPRRLRRHLAAAWTTQGVDEHASVASFARLTLELLRLGAPAELVAEATRAQADEVRHAQLAFAVASDLLGAPVGPGRTDLAGVLDRSDDAGAVLVRAVLEGCFNETICAAFGFEVAERADDPWLRAELTALAEDEARHAELSWALVRWLVSSRPELAPLAAEAAASFTIGPRPAAHPLADVSSRWGHLDPAAQHDVAVRVIERVVLPALGAVVAEGRRAA